MISHSLALQLHLAAGTLALTSFWLAAWLKKGSAAHRRVGQVYLTAMLAVILSGVPLVWAVLAQGRLFSTLFLGYLLILVSNGCIAALRATRLKRSRQAYFGPVYWFLQSVTAACGLFVMGVGLSVGATLLVVFGSIGVFTLLGGWFAWRRAPQRPDWWLREHYGAMIGNGVATHIAFLAIGLQRLVPGLDPGLQQALAWFGPLLVAVLVGIRLGRRRPSAPARSAAR